MIKRWRYVWVWARERKKSWGKCRKINGILMDNKMVLTSWREEKIVKNLIMLEIAYRKSLKVGDYLSKFLDNVALNASIWKYSFREIIVVTISIKFHMLMHAREKENWIQKTAPSSTSSLSSASSSARTQYYIIIMVFVWMNERKNLW